MKDMYYNNPQVILKNSGAGDLIGPFNTLSEFCKKYSLPSPGIFNLVDAAKVVKKLKFLKMKKVITVERMGGLYNLAISADDESKKLAEKIISTLMEKTK